jgi:hypothetical protein
MVASPNTETRAGSGRVRCRDNTRDQPRDEPVAPNASG